MFSNSNKNEMVQYCRQKNIRKYSTLNRQQLIFHIIKFVYFRALKDYGNKRAYEELRDTYHSKTEEYKNNIKTLEEKIINSEEASNHEEMMAFVNGKSIEDMSPNKVKEAILYTINVIQSIKKSNEDKTKLTKELMPHKLKLRKLKSKYEELTGTPWTPENRSIIKSRTTDVKLKMFIESIKSDNPKDKIVFEEIVNQRYDNLYEDYKRYSLEMDKSFPLDSEQLLFHGTDEKNISSILENDFALINKAAHGTAYGSGIYFTNKLGLACSYSHDPKIKYVLVCNVHIGRKTSGIVSQTNLPKGYHTAVDNLRNPVQYIKKKNNQYTFIGLLKIHVSSDSKLINNNLRYNSSLRVNNHNFHTDIQILFLKSGTIVPTGVDYVKFTKDLLTKALEGKDSLINVQRDFIKLNPAKVKSHTIINCNLNNIYVLGYYDEQSKDNKIIKEFIITRIDKIEKNNKIVTL